ncbi:MAG: type II secretion system GspH family protein [Candidatus Pacebacteria bacterium]|nr:type II secretion system GspH family protein [Candidatus Paceibacterota bacterium]
MINKKKGFTLIELLVVIAIIGILSSVVLASLNSARVKARDAKRVSDLKQIQLAFDMYFDSCGQYPPAGGTSPFMPAGTTNTGCPTGFTLATFLPTIPTDPVNSGSNRYNYVRPSVTAYCLGVDMEGAPPAGTAACVNATGFDTNDYEIAP